MLLTVAALVWTLQRQQPVDKPTLELYQQRFVVRKGEDTFRVPISWKDLPPPAAQFRKDHASAVWDERGLTIRNDRWSFDTRLAELPVSPRMQSRQEIIKTLDLVKQGVRSLEANAISGAKRFGSKAYFLVRWDGKDHRPWLEALVSVDLNSAKSKPKLEGAFAGLSLGRQPIDDLLLNRSDQFCVAVNTDSGWGMATFDPSNGAFDFHPVGQTLQSFLPLSNGGGAYVETTAYDASLAGVIDKSFQSKTVFENRGGLRYLDEESPAVLVANGSSGRMLFSAESGAEMKIGPADEIRRAGPYVLIWSPPANPQEARLYEPGRWRLAASWHASR